MINSFAITDKKSCPDNTDNTYTSFKGFPLVGIWQEKPEIIAITDIKQKIVIKQVLVLQRFSYYI